RRARPAGTGRAPGRRLPRAAAGAGASGAEGGEGSGGVWAHTFPGAGRARVRHRA
ncbi:unnamed protein product, partial [Heterosigma akashiwo]